MTREEFAKVIAYITAGSGKSLEHVSIEVYFDLLGDLSYETLLVAARRVLLKHRYATFPSIAELREAAVLTQTGAVSELSAGEAWSLAWRAIGNTDPEIDGSWVRASASLPPLVKRAIEVYGVHALCFGGEPLTVIRAQFTKIYDQLASRERENALLPAGTRQAIAAQGKPQTQMKPASKPLAIAGWMPEAPPTGRKEAKS